MSLDLTPRQAGLVLRVPTKTVRYWIKRKWLHTHRQAGTDFIKRDYLNYWKNTHLENVKNGKGSQIFE